jgi:DNA-binding Xre family transcriptional regulator
MNNHFTMLKVHLMKNGISQTKLSFDTGLHKNTISKLLRTGEGTKSVKELVRLYLHLDKDEFYDLLHS